MLALESAHVLRDLLAVAEAYPQLRASELYPRFLLLAWRPALGAAEGACSIPRRIQQRRRRYKMSTDLHAA